MFLDFPENEHFTQEEVFSLNERIIVAPVLHQHKKTINIKNIFDIELVVNSVWPIKGRTFRLQKPIKANKKPICITFPLVNLITFAHLHLI